MKDCAIIHKCDQSYRYRQSKTDFFLKKYLPVKKYVLNVVLLMSKGVDFIVCENWDCCSSGEPVANMTCLEKKPQFAAD